MTSVVIVGGGFGGLSAARALKQAPANVTLIDRRNFHLFQPLLYQVATGSLSPANIATPLRSILRKQRNLQVFLNEVVGFDIENRRLLLKDGELSYDYLIVATGARHHYFGHEEWEAWAPGLKTIEDATAIRSRILLAFEAAERGLDPQALQSWLTFVVVGGGPTGVELAGALGEIANHTLKNDYRVIRPSETRIVLLEATDRVLPTYPPALSKRAEQDLARLGVDVRTETAVTGVSPDAVLFKHHDKNEQLRTRTVLWAAGVKASPLGQALANATGAQIDRNGRVFVGADLGLPGHPDIFVIGDLAHFEQDAKPLPAIAPVAMQQGRYVADVIANRLRAQASHPFRYRDRGNMATIGRSAAVADFGRIKLTGLTGWLTWLFIHLMNLAQFENRLLVLIQWSWNYLTRSRSARLITGDGAAALTSQREIAEARDST